MGALVRKVSMNAAQPHSQRARGGLREAQRDMPLEQLVFPNRVTLTLDGH